MKQWEWEDLQLKTYKIKLKIKDSKKEKYYKRIIIRIINKKLKKIKIPNNP